MESLKQPEIDPFWQEKRDFHTFAQKMQLEANTHHQNYLKGQRPNMKSYQYDHQYDQVLAEVKRCQRRIEFKRRELEDKGITNLNVPEFINPLDHQKAA